jgi:hypothetical protein
VLDFGVYMSFTWPLTVGRCLERGCYEFFWGGERESYDFWWVLGRLFCVGLESGDG